MKKITFLTICVLVMTLVLAACGGGTTTTGPQNGGASTPSTDKDENKAKEEKYVIRAAYAYPSGSVIGKVFPRFKEIVEERSNGRLTLEIYSDAQLMPASAELPAILSGEIDMALSTILSSIEPNYYIFDVPFLFASHYEPKDFSVYINTIRKFLNNEGVHEKLMGSMEKRGFKVIANTYALSDPQVIFSVDKNDVFKKVESIKGKKLRVLKGEIAAATLDALDASGVTIPTAEMIPALQQGVVDGAITSLSYVADINVPVDAVTLIPIFTPASPILMSKAKFDSLPADLQEIIVEAGKEVEQYSDEFMIKHYQAGFKKLEDKGMNMYTPTKDEIQAWKEAVQPARGKFEKMVPNGKEFLEAAEAALEG